LKNTKLMGVAAETDNASNVFALHFAFEPQIALAGMTGKRVSIKMSRKFKAADVADSLIKAGNMLYDELRKD